MKISQSARSAIDAIVRRSEPGSLPSLTLGYRYDDAWNKSPVVEIASLPPDVVKSMASDYANFGDELLQEFDGITFAMILADDDGMLEGRLLTYVDSEFVLKAG